MIKLNYKSETWTLPPVAMQNWSNISYFKCPIKQIVNWISFYCCCCCTGIWLYLDNGLFADRSARVYQVINYIKCQPCSC